MLFLWYPKCSTCRKARAWLEAQGVAFTSRHIVEEPPSAGELAAWQQACGLPLRRFFNTSGMLYRELGVKKMLDDGMSFSLVPWKPVIEQRLGQQLAATMRGSGISWQVERQLGI